MNEPHPYWTYVLWSNSGERFYIGVTDDVPRRLQEHNTGVSKWTQRYAGSWQLIWQQQFPTLGEARSLENLLKRQKGGQGFFQHTGLDPAIFRRSSSGS